MKKKIDYTKCPNYPFCMIKKVWNEFIYNFVENNIIIKKLVEIVEYIDSTIPEWMSDIIEILFCTMLIIGTGIIAALLIIMLAVLITKQ